MKTLQLAIFFLVFMNLSEIAQALPIGFGRTQGGLEYSEVVSPNFHVYFDKRTPREGQAISNSLEAGLPILEQWFNIQRNRSLPVIMSSTTSNASFANFITDALELQTLGRGGRDLAWHELTHNIMYRHLDNFFGPVGNIIHLPWMPAWWLEGLAEATSHSIGSDQIYSVERYTALSGNWPSYAKLHSLYHGPFSYTGYAISGAFVSYILRTYGAEKIPAILEDFFDYTLPWWWPWSMIPFNGFMPMDAALAKHTGKSGEELYEEYKAAATKHWQSQNLPPLLKEKVLSEKIPQKSPKKAGSRGTVWSSTALQMRNNKLYNTFFFTDEDEQYEVEVRFRNPRLGSDNIKFKKMPAEALAGRITYGPVDVYATMKTNNNLDPISTLHIKRGKKFKKRIKRFGYIRRIFRSEGKITWHEVNRESSKICSISEKLLYSKKKLKKSKVNCFVKVKYPVSIEYLGERLSQGEGHLEVQDVWFVKSSETLVGDRYEIFRFNPATEVVSKVANPWLGKPLSVSFQGGKTYLLMSDHNRQFVRVFDAQGRCEEELLTSNHITQFLNSDKYFYAVSVEGTRRWVYRTSAGTWPSRSCRQSSMPSSPMLFALRTNNNSFADALSANNPWSEKGKNAVSSEKMIATTKPLHQYPKPMSSPKEALWRGRPVFAFPWIGADAEGYQFGVISVPLMDHLQNETVTLTALYGLYSQFPNLELGIESTRFKPHLKTKIFRRQAWNGVYDGSSFYFDERGVELSSSRYFRGPGISTSFGVTAVDRLPYLGTESIWPFFAQGYALELSASLGQGFSLGDNTLSYSVSSKVAPEQVNDNFKYNKLSLGSSFNMPISILGMNTKQSYGLSYSRTRGKRRPYLREVYRPLKTFIPGSGGGFNEINVNLLGPGLLTNAKYGDTQARFRWAWTFPLVRHLETLIHIFYLERLDFTAFFNYGNAWNQQIQPAPEDFVKAHGYNLDLQSDIKGVTVNLGLGTGQVFEEDWDVYFLFGFDALINP